MSFRRVILALLCLFIAASFLTLPRNALQSDDAAAYALMAKNMIVHHQWLAPLFTPGDPTSFEDKPPLGIWLLAWFPKLFGVSELTVHVPNVIYFTLILVILYWALGRLSSRKIALYATLFAATSLCLVVYSRAPKLDIPLTLFVLTAHLALYGWLKQNKSYYLLIFAASLALGFLIKTGFGLLLPLLTVLFLLLFNARARQRFFKLLSTPYPLLPICLFALIIGSVLFAQSFALKDQWLPYLKSIIIASKYNTGYLGFGFYYSIIGFLLIAVFPWTPLALLGLKAPLNRRKKSQLQTTNDKINPSLQTPNTKLGSCRLKLEVTSRKLNLNTFCSLWFWSNFFCLLFFYKQSDLRTFTVFVPPLAILAAIKLISINWKPRLSVAAFQVFFLMLFLAILIPLLAKPVNPQGFSLADAIVPLSLFTVSLIPLTSYLWRPSATKFIVSFALICLAYGTLFYNTKPLADAFNPDVKWPGLIREYQNKGFSFYIYRPHDRNLFYSPDLCYVDFLAGPADKYFWDQETLRGELKKGKAIVLSDTESWNKLNLCLPVLAQDNYSLIVGKL
jgi:4-amino-4-deoxy-L-arabinose transferase-like glycosyltransferase